MRPPERSDDYQLPIPAWTLLLPLEWDRYDTRTKLRWLRSQITQLQDIQAGLREIVDEETQTRRLRQHGPWGWISEPR